MTNRQGVTRSVWACGVALLVACGSDKHGAFVPPGGDGDGDGGATARAGSGNSSGRGGSGGRGGNGNMAGSADIAGQGGSAGMSPAAPVIEITTPGAAKDPNVDTILVEDQVTVLCTVTKSSASGAKPVDPSTVKIALLDADGKPLKTNAGATTSNDSEYSSTFVLTAGTERACELHLLGGRHRATGAQRVGKHRYLGRSGPGDHDWRAGR